MTMRDLSQLGELESVIEGFERSPAVIAVYAAQDGRVLAANAVARMRAGPEEPDLAELLAQQLQTAMRQVVATGAPFHADQWRLRSHDQAGGLTPGTSGFADSTAVLMASESSLDLLNGRILERGAEPVPMRRFRPNIVVSGWAEPHTEDLVRSVRLGTAELGYAKVCIRCAVTTVDQETGDRRGPEPLRTLAGYRRADEGGVSFGAKFAVTRPGVLAVGDELEVTAWGEAEQGLGARLSEVLL
jgi:hypothetical protein